MTRPSRRVGASPGPSLVRRVGAPTITDFRKSRKPDPAGNVRRYGPFRTRYHPLPIPILAEARGLMPLSEICLRTAIGAFVVGLAPFSLAIFYKYLGYISASDITLTLA